MDTTDFKIIRILNKNSRRSYRNIAKELRISGAAVKKRIEQMINEGVILGFEIGFDPSLLGLDTCIADLKLKSGVSKRKIVTELKKIKNIYFVTCAIDNTSTLLFHYCNSKDLEDIIERIGSVKNVLDVTTGIPRSRLSTNIKISSLGWEIIQSLNHNARKKNHEIARELEVSPKTIKRRLDRLIKNKVICFTIDVDLSKAWNYTMYVLAIELETGVKREKIYKEIKNKFGAIWGVAGGVQPSIVLFMYAKQLSQIEGVVEGLKRISGVKTANVSLYTSYHRFTEWYDKKIEEMTKK